MHRSRLAALGIDCQTEDLEAMAEFWSAALGYSLRPVDSDGRYIMMQGPAEQPMAFVQRVEHEPRVHLDIETDDIEAEVERLKGLGAVEVARIQRWVVMEAPSGHRFCVVPPQRADFPAGANDWPRT